MSANTTPLSLSVTPELLEALKANAKETDRSYSQVIRAALRLYLGNKS